MRLSELTGLATVCLALILQLSPASAFFFPNISATPPSLIPNFTIPSGPWDVFHNFTGCQAGERRDGLGNLKKYFHNFGYIPDGSGANFTDDFDDALEAAIKTYQRNFNLDPTGQLDDATLKQIVKPRCGNPDIVNGSTSMTSGKETAASAFHTVGRYAFFPGTPRWPADRRDLTYGFNPGNDIPETARSAFARAFQRWADVTTLTFAEAASYASADITIGFYSGDHGDGEAFDGPLGTLAHAFSPPNGRFHLDGAEDWVVEGDVTKSSVSNAVDLESVAVHEIGHLLGLGHSSVEESIMYPTISSRTRKVDLATDDVQGIQVLYGSNPNYNGSTTSPSASQERDSGGSGSHAAPVGPAALLLAVASAALAMLLLL